MDPMLLSSVGKVNEKEKCSAGENKVINKVISETESYGEK